MAPVLGARGPLRALLGGLLATCAGALRNIDGGEKLEVKRGGGPQEPAPAPTSMVRLRRVDHGGSQSLLESEERWASGVGTHSFVRGFRELPHLQLQRLRDHHREALAQPAADEPPEQQEAAPLEASSMTERHAARRQRAHTAAQGLVVRLQGLSSQYVGPVGVGTAVLPAGCSKLGEPAPLLPDFDAGNASGAACRATSQSTMQVIHDTGSTNFWLFSRACQDPACVDARRVRYDPAQSSSFVEYRNQNPLTITFGTGRIEGNLGAEDFRIGPFTVKRQQFGMINKVEGTVFEQPEIGGILGLAFKEMSANHAAPLFDNMIQQHVLPANRFGFWLSPNNPSANAIFWGPVDHAFYKDELSYFPVTDPYYWAVDLDTFQIGDEVMLGIGNATSPPESKFRGNLHPMMAARAALLQNRNSRRRLMTPKLIFDSGTTFFTAGANLFEKIIMRLPAVACHSMTRESHPDILFRLRDIRGNKVDFTFSNMEYMVRSSAGEDSECTPAFMKIDVPEEHDGPSMLAGQTFNLKHVVEYDRGNGNSAQARVGLGLALHGPEQEQALRGFTQQQELRQRAAVYDAAALPVPLAAAA